MSELSISTKQSNWFHLQHLIGHSCICLRRLFKNRFQKFYNLTWDDTKVCGTKFFTTIVSPKPQFKLFSSQKAYIQDGNSDKWDVSLLTILLLNIQSKQSLTQTEHLQLKNEDKLLKDIRDIRNELAHHSTREINDSDFETHWQKLKNILVFFGEDDTELEKMKDDIEFKSAKEEEDADSRKKMEILVTCGDKFFDSKNYNDAIQHYTQALTLPKLLSKTRAVLYSNRSRTRLALYGHNHNNNTDDVSVMMIEDERFHALRDAKEARKLWSTWWKAHYCVGNAYALMNEHEKAINSFQRALALDASNTATEQALNSSKSAYSEQQRNEHLDPRIKQQTMDEHLTEMKEKYEIDPEQVRLGHLLKEKNIDTTAINVINGHKYFFGDVKCGIKEDHDRAAKYYAAAANQKNAEGTYNLAMMYDRGQGVQKNVSLATDLYRRAALQSAYHQNTNKPNIGVAESQHALGLRYYNGLAVNKNLVIAAYWYERAARHGCENAANNLGAMYLEGTGVTQDREKAKQWFKFAARKGDINAMASLAELKLEDNNFLMARLWFERACEAGNLIAQTKRDVFERTINEKEAFLKQCPQNCPQIIKPIVSYLSDIHYRKPVASKRTGPKYNYEELKRYAEEGSMTAKLLCQALEHFYTALFMVLQSKNIDESKFLHELAEAYRIEHIVVQYPDYGIPEKFRLLVDQNFKNQPDNEDAQICYVYSLGDDFEQQIKIIDHLKAKKPKSIHLLLLSADINCFLKRWDIALLDCNTGLKLDPNNYELQYTKAVALRCIEHPNKNDVLEAYRIFLANAPKDHRKVPEAYYAMAQRSFPEEKPTAPNTQRSKTIPDEVLKIYNLGLEAEKAQLPCYLPYESSSKPYFDVFFEMDRLSNTSSIEPDQITPVVSSRHNLYHLLDPRRIELFREHRRFLSRLEIILDSNSNSVRITSTNLPSHPQKRPKKLTNLKPISLEEIDPTKNYIYDGHVLSVTIVEQTLVATPSILLLVEDENLDVERLFIYGFHEKEGQQLIEDVFVIGYKMDILNPALKIGTTDLKPGIRVDDFSSIIMQNKSERVPAMCRCCGEANARYRCSRCKAYYCRSECQKIDWKKYKHRLLCKMVKK